MQGGDASLGVGSFDGVGPSEVFRSFKGVDVMEVFGVEGVWSVIRRRTSG